MVIWHSPSPRYSPRVCISRGPNTYWLPIGRIGQTLQLHPKPPPLSPPRCLPSLCWLTLNPSLHSTSRPPSCNTCLLRRASPCRMALPSLTWLPLTEDNSLPCS